MYERIGAQPNFSRNFLRGGSRFSPDLYILLTIGKIRGTRCKKVDDPHPPCHLIYQYLSTYTYPYLHISQYTDRACHIIHPPHPLKPPYNGCILLYNGNALNSASTYSLICSMNVGHVIRSS